jgi:hypothetical protein
VGLCDVCRVIRRVSNGANVPQLWCASSTYSNELLTHGCCRRPALRLLQERGRHWRRLAGAASLASSAELACSNAEDEAQAQQLQAMLGHRPGGPAVAAVLEEVTGHIPHLAPGVEFSGLQE